MFDYSDEDLDETCPECSGYGYDDYADEDCYMCDGTDTFWRVVMSEFGLDTIVSNSWSFEYYSVHFRSTIELRGSRSFEDSD